MVSLNEFQSNSTDASRFLRSSQDAVLQNIFQIMHAGSEELLNSSDCQSKVITLIKLVLRIY